MERALDWRPFPALRFWLETGITLEAQQWLSAAAVQPPEMRRASLKAAAARVGVDDWRCPWLLEEPQRGK